MTAKRAIIVGDCIIDVSATLMPPSYDQVFALIKELGLEDQLEECRGESVTFRDGKPYAVKIDDFCFLLARK
jgi:hypothetical protein